MAGFCGIIGNASGVDRLDIASTVDLTGQAGHRSFSGADFHFEVAYRENDPLKGRRFYEDDRLILLFHGDFVGYDAIPWEAIAEKIKNGDFSFFRKLSGIFSFFAYDKSDGTARLISDRRAQDHLYYHRGKDRFIFSTDLSTFCRIFDTRFNEEWLYEYVFFNHSVTERTPIADVFRVCYAEILTYSGGAASLEKYADIYRPKDNLMSGRDSLEHAYEVFADRVPEYYKGSGNIACALTGGWDARTSLAFAPDLDKVLTYTYGVPGAADQLIASDFARRTGIRHELIDLDDEFARNLPGYMLKSVFLSSGLNHIGRSSLYFTYNKLCREMNMSLLISGIHLDSIFRGHGHIPASMSYGMVDLLKGNFSKLDEYGFIRSDEFRGHIRATFDQLADLMGDPTSNAFHLLYLLYCNSQNFEGEIKIADQFGTIRVPAWDDEILELAFSIEESTLTFSQYGDHKRGDWPEMLLQSYLLRKARKKFAGIPVGATSPNWVLKGRRAHLVKSYFNRISNRIRYFPGLGRVPLENNRRWIKGVHKDLVEKLVLSESSRVRSHFSDNYLREIIKSEETHYTLKIVTAELIMRLVENGWRLSDLEEDVLKLS